MLPQVFWHLLLQLKIIPTTIRESDRLLVSPPFFRLIFRHRALWRAESGRTWALQTNKHSSSSCTPYIWVIHMCYVMSTDVILRTKFTLSDPSYRNVWKKSINNMGITWFHNFMWKISCTGAVFVNHMMVGFARFLKLVEILRNNFKTFLFALRCISTNSYQFVFVCCFF